MNLMLVNIREMMVKKRPWAGEEPAQIIQAVTSNTRLKIPKDCDPIFARVMKMCWRHTPAQRYVLRRRTYGCGVLTAWRSFRPTFDKLADILANYYKQLHVINANAFESSEPESDPESEGTRKWLRVCAVAHIVLVMSRGRVPF